MFSINTIITRWVGIFVALAVLVGGVVVIQRLRPAPQRLRPTTTAQPIEVLGRLVYGKNDSERGSFKIIQQDLKTGAQTVLYDAAGELLAARFDADQKTMAVSSSKGLELLTLATGQTTPLFTITKQRQSTGIEPPYGATWDNEVLNKQSINEIRNLQWSPDGRFLAFDTFGYEWSYANVLELSTKTITQLEHTGGVQWSSDGRFLTMAGIDRFGGEGGVLIWPTGRWDQRTDLTNAITEKIIALTGLSVDQTLVDFYSHFFDPQTGHLMLSYDAGNSEKGKTGIVRVDPATSAIVSSIETGKSAITSMRQRLKSNAFYGTLPRSDKGSWTLVRWNADVQTLKDVIAWSNLYDASLVDWFDERTAVVVLTPDGSIYSGSVLLIDVESGATTYQSPTLSNNDIFVGVFPEQP